MRRAVSHTFLLALSLFVVTASVSHSADERYLARYAVTGDFATVKEDVVLAIQNRGLVVDHTSHIGEMLTRTGKDIGATKNVYQHAEAVSFCSATISRDTMEADPANIAFCPYTIAVYVTVSEPKKVYVTFRHPLRDGGSKESRAALNAVETLLTGIVREALNLK